MSKKRIILVAEIGKKFLLTLILVWMGVIFYFSSQTAIQSNGLSMGITEKVIDKAGSLATDAVGIMKLDEVIRSLAHGGIFFVLGLLVGFACRRIGRWGWLMAIGICVLYSICDEAHQIFVPGRGYEFVDLMKDWVGSGLGIGAVWVVSKVRVNLKLI